MLANRTVKQPIALAESGKEVADHVGQLRIPLSGTPMENKLHDLQCQLEYILPGYLATSRAEFRGTSIPSEAFTRARVCVQILYDTILYYTVFGFTILYYTLLKYTLLYFTIFDCTLLY